MQSLARVLLALAVGLTLGSVLPAELFAKRRRVDLRAVGDGNPGTWNAFRAFGKGPGLVTLAYDVSVGVIAIGVARLLGVSEGVTYLAGIMAVVGHRFPVFKGFRGGGQGMAATAGLIVFGFAEAVSRGWLSASDLGVLVAIMGATYLVSRSWKLVAIIMLPVLVAEVMLAGADWQFTAFMAACAGYIWFSQLAAYRRARARRYTGMISSIVTILP